MKKQDLLIAAIAAACHEKNRAYCARIGGDTQAPWDEAPSWQKDSAIARVREILKGDIQAPEQQRVKDDIFFEAVASCGEALGLPTSIRGPVDKLRAAASSAATYLEINHSDNKQALGRARKLRDALDADRRNP